MLLASYLLKRTNFYIYKKIFLCIETDTLKCFDFMKGLSQIRMINTYNIPNTLRFEFSQY